MLAMKGLLSKWAKPAGTQPAAPTATSSTTTTTTTPPPVQTAATKPPPQPSTGKIGESSSPMAKWMNSQAQKQQIPTPAKQTASAPSTPTVTIPTSPAAVRAETAEAEPTEKKRSAAPLEATNDISTPVLPPTQSTTTTSTLAKSPAPKKTASKPKNTVSAPKATAAVVSPKAEEEGVAQKKTETPVIASETLLAVTIAQSSTNTSSVTEDTAATVMGAIISAAVDEALDGGDKTGVVQDVVVQQTQSTASGSIDVSIPANEASAAGENGEPKKKRGRPKGSVSKPKIGPDGQPIVGINKDGTPRKKREKKTVAATPVLSTLVDGGNKEANVMAEMAPSPEPSAAMDIDTSVPSRSSDIATASVADASTAPAPEQPPKKKRAPRKPKATTATESVPPSSADVAAGNNVSAPIDGTADATVDQAQKKKRGRKPKPATLTSENPSPVAHPTAELNTSAMDVDDVPPPTGVAAASPVPAVDVANNTVTEQSTTVNAEATPPKKKRAPRKPKVTTAANPSSNTPATSFSEVAVPVVVTDATTASEEPAKKKRVRKPKQIAAPVTNETEDVPAAAVAPSETSQSNEAVASVPTSVPATETIADPAPKKKRAGRPKKTAVVEAIETLPTIKAALSEPTTVDVQSTAAVVDATETSPTPALPKKKRNPPNAALREIVAILPEHISLTNGELFVKLPLVDDISENLSIISEDSLDLDGEADYKIDTDEEEDDIVDLDDSNDGEDVADEDDDDEADEEEEEDEEEEADGENEEDVVDEKLLVEIVEKRAATASAAELDGPFDDSKLEDQSLKVFKLNNSEKIVVNAPRMCDLSAMNIVSSKRQRKPVRHWFAPVEIDDESDEEENDEDENGSANGNDRSARHQRELYEDDQINPLDEVDPQDPIYDIDDETREKVALAREKYVAWKVSRKKRKRADRGGEDGEEEDEDLAIAPASKKSKIVYVLPE